MAKKQKNKSQSGGTSSSPKHLIENWKASSKMAKASKICNIIIPILLSLLFLASFLIAFIPNATGMLSAKASSFESFLIAFISTTLVCAVIPAPFFGLLRNLLDAFCTISLGNYIRRNFVDARGIYESQKNGSKHDKRLISRALLTNERKGTRALFFVRAGGIFTFAIIDMSLLAMLLNEIKYLVEGSTTIDILRTAIVANAFIFGFMVATAVFSGIFSTVFDKIINSKSESNMYVTK